MAFGQSKEAILVLKDVIVLRITLKSIADYNGIGFTVVGDLKCRMTLYAAQHYQSFNKDN